MTTNLLNVHGRKLKNASLQHIGHINTADAVKTQSALPEVSLSIETIDKIHMHFVYTEINYCSQVEPLVRRKKLPYLVNSMHDSINLVLLFLFVKKRDATPSGVIKESSFFHKNCLNRCIK